MHNLPLGYSAAIKHNERSSLYREKSKQKMYVRWWGIQKNMSLLKKGVCVCVYMYKISGKIWKKQVILVDFGEGIWVARQKWNEGHFTVYFWYLLNFELCYYQYSMNE